jgi:hypothetical protein
MMSNGLFLKEMIPYCMDFYIPTMSLHYTGFFNNVVRFSSCFRKSIKGWYNDYLTSFFLWSSGFLHSVFSTCGSYLPKINKNSTQNIEIVVSWREQSKDNTERLFTGQNLGNDLEQFFFKGLYNQNCIISFGE